MIQDIAPKVFYNEYVNKQPDDEAFVLIFKEGKCLIRRDRFEEIHFPEKALCGESLLYTYLFRIDGEEYFLGNFIKENDLDSILAYGYDWEEMQAFRLGDPRDRCFAGITGFQLYNWYRRHRFCGTCGCETRRDENERMLFCPQCGEMYYPQICPGVIVGVTHNGRLLMSRYRDRAYRHFALIAGFTEVGETPEQTVYREVMEEVGLPVKNIRYYKSQPWPFTDTLLMGFFCELDGDDETILLEENELAEAGWYLPEEIPAESLDSGRVSLTSEMMTLFRDCGGRLPKRFGQQQEETKKERNRGKKL